jgi:hypothetical protein
MRKLFYLFLASAILAVPSISISQKEHPHDLESVSKKQAGAVSLDLITRKQNFAIGEKWAVFASVNNLSDVPIWITSETSLLTIPTEVLGQSRRFFAQFAFLPTLGDEVSNEHVRINPGEKYIIEWYVDGLDEPGSDDRIGVGFRFIKILKEFLLFKPDEYPFTAIVHYWNTPPSIENGRFNLSNTKMVSEVRSIQIEGSPIVLILGAAIGGMFAFAIRSFVSTSIPSVKAIRTVSMYLIGLVSTMLFCVVGVILLERLSKSDFPVAVSVKDFWGAIAIGFVLEWWGLKGLRTTIKSREGSTRGQKEKMPNNSIEADGPKARPEL